MNRFLDCEQTLSETALEAVNELIFSKRLPDDFLAHYAKNNGGRPEKEWFPADDEWDPIWVQCFYSIKFAKDESLTLEAHYRRMVEKRIIPESLVPFAVDPGGNFVCIDLDTHAVSYFTTDTFDPEATPQENQRSAQRVIADSFGDFLSKLTTEDEAFG